MQKLVRRTAGDPANIFGNLPGHLPGHAETSAEDCGWPGKIVILGDFGDLGRIFLVSDFLVDFASFLDFPAWYASIGHLQLSVYPLSPPSSPPTPLL
jgi:hypothetical protein